MAGLPSRKTVAEALIQRLADLGVRHIFGYPGGQVSPLYDALYGQGAIRHILARDEQAAAFMADGYARATGRPGVCLAVCGPGVLNAATALASSFTDSVPVLLLSGQVPSAGLGPRSGYYHENDQLTALATFTKWRKRVLEPSCAVADLDQAHTALTEGRPGPAFLEIPVDLLRAEFPADRMPTMPPRLPTRVPSPDEVQALVGLLAGWRRPLILAGGGVLASDAVSQVETLARSLGSPVLTTLTGKTAIAADHPHAAGLTWFGATSDVSNMEPMMSRFFTAADGMLAIGCRFSQVSTGSWAIRIPPSLAQIDIDPSEIGRHYPVAQGVAADAAATLDALLEALPQEQRAIWSVAGPTREPRRWHDMDLVRILRRVLPRDAIVAADITQLSYMMLAGFPTYLPRTFLHPAGYVAMGYGIPAALGAKTAFPERTVVAVVGDGCFMMSGMELATAVQEKLPIVVILINDGSLTLIKSIQERRYGGRYLGVDLRNPDFALLARAFGVAAWQADSEATFEESLRAALESGEPALVEVRPPGQNAG
jgi:thiamine pyrophosphate-dependent acetolactate synthase large subunit-like protein